MQRINILSIKTIYKHKTTVGNKVIPVFVFYKLHKVKSRNVSKILCRTKFVTTKNYQVFLSTQENNLLRFTYKRFMGSINKYSSNPDFE